MRNPGAILSVLLLLLPAVCTAQATVNIPDIEKSASVAVKDLRPAAEKQDEIFSYSISNDAYGITRKGEGSITPSAIRILQHRAFEKSGGDAQSPGMTVHHMLVYLNGRTALRRTVVMGAIGGLIGSAISGSASEKPGSVVTTLVDARGFDLSPQEYQRALYTEAENPGHAAVYVIFIETEISGKRVFTRTVAPFKKGEASPIVAPLESAIRDHLSQY